MCADELDLALSMIRNGPFKRDNSILLLGDFNDGLMGIISSRLVEVFKLPTIVFCRDRSNPGFIKGSGRAPDHFNLYQAICSCSRFLEKFGGHSAAAGMSLSEKYFDLFSEAFDETSSRILDSLKSRSLLSQNGEATIELAVSEALNPVLVRNISQLEPLGEANPRPIFIDREAQFVATSFFGSNREHVRGTLRGKYQNVPVLGFSVAEKIHRVKENEAFCLLYSHMLDGYNGSNTWKLRIHDAWP
jgi:single-stranded-DNA-specific exonuclease